MDNYIDILLKLPLFEGMAQDELMKLTANAPRTVYNAGEAVFLAGEEAKYIGAVLEGSVMIVKEDLYGNRNILAAAGQGQVFGEAFVCAGIRELPVSVFAAERSVIMLMDYSSILNGGSSERAVYNMLKLMARKNIFLNGKIEIMSKRSTREKLLTYLSEEARRSGGREFAIPFNRQELADFLSVDRSAMSMELGRLRRDGIIDFKKNKFKIL